MITITLKKEDKLEILNVLKKTEKRVYSLESPIDVFVDSICQIDYTLFPSFEHAHNQVLKHKPDIVVIEEV